MNKPDPKYLVRHYISTPNAIYNTLFTTRLEMRKFVTTLQKKYGIKLNYKILTLFDCHSSENTMNWSEDGYKTKEINDDIIIAE